MSKSSSDRAKEKNLREMDDRIPMHGLSRQKVHQALRLLPPISTISLNTLDSPLFSLYIALTPSNALVARRMKPRSSFGLVATFWFAPLVTIVGMQMFPASTSYGSN